MGDSTFTTTSLIHGNELTSYKVNREIYAKNKEYNHFYFPICNPYGFKKNIRVHPTMGDLNRNPTTKSYSFKKMLDDFISKSDFYIDLHSWNKRSEKFILVNKIKDNVIGEKKAQEVKKRIITFSKLTGLPLIVDTRGDTGHLIEKSIIEKGIPSVIIECGGHHVDDSTARRLSDKILNGLECLSENSYDSYDKIYRRKYLYSEMLGDIIPNYNEGEPIEKGEVICSIDNGNKRKEIICNESGWVTAFNSSLKITSSFREICHFAVESDSDCLYSSN